MKTILNQSLVLKFSINEKPELIKGQIRYVGNPNKVPYIIFDEHRDAPVGFGVKIGSTKKTYIIQRRVSSEKVIKAKVGNVSDFLNIEYARKRAREVIDIAITTKRNPNEISREKNIEEITLKDAFAIYRNYLLGKAKPATKNTLNVFDGALKRLAQIENKKINDISGQEVLLIFDNIAANHRTAAEQTFRWANVATKFAIAIREHQALSQNNVPSIKYNPFQILTTNKKYRTSSQLEESYQKKGIRKPLTIQKMKDWLTEVIKRRKSNRTGCDYLLLTTLWGTRKNEALNLKWHDLIDENEAFNSSWVCLEKRIVLFHDTKNRSDFQLPIADAAFEILNQRHELNSPHRNLQNKWVFPAEKKHSKSGHYTDMKTLVKSICIEANISPIGLHDLRRTFGRFAEEHVSYALVKKLLNHSNSRDVTSRYTDPEQDKIKIGMQKIELEILHTTPDVYNLFLSPKHKRLELNESSKSGYP